MDPSSSYKIGKDVIPIEVQLTCQYCLPRYTISTSLAVMKTNPFVQQWIEAVKDGALFSNSL